MQCFHMLGNTTKKREKKQKKDKKGIARGRERW